MIYRNDDPPERPEPPGGPYTQVIGKGVCHECDEEYGPKLAEDIGIWLHLNHSECSDTEVETWEETWKYDAEQDVEVLIDSER